jgi:hypothetical protein
MFASLEGGAVSARRSLPKLSAILVVAAAAWPVGANATVETVPMGPAPATASSATAPPTTIDLRSPDARDAGRVAQATLVQDLRSPDTRDAAAGLNVGAPVSHAAPSASDGFEWGEAGAAAMLALLGLAAGTALLTVRIRRRPA